MISRRAFVLGGAGLLTFGFAARAERFAAARGEPLLLPAAGATTTLHLFANPAWSDFDVFNKWLVSLGPAQYDPPPAPTWRQFLVEHRGLTGVAPEHRLPGGLTHEELDETMPAETWGSFWEYFASPQARAYELLQELDIAIPFDASGRRAGSIDFIEWGYHPGSNERLVELRDDLSVSLLQAALLERGRPIQIHIDE